MSSPSCDIQTRKRARDLTKSAEPEAAEAAVEVEEIVATKVAAKAKKSTPADVEIIKPVASRQQIKALAESELCQDDDVDYRLTTKLNLPFTWKKFAVDEWSIITTTTPITDRKLLRLPRANTLKDTMLSYLTETKSTVSAEEFKASVSFFGGLMLYFDRVRLMSNIGCVC
jgi:hypothetical protein